MSDQKPIEPTSADELAKSKKSGDIQLSEEDLKEVVGGGKASLSDFSFTCAIDKTTPL
jgi:hypothetical protein